MPVIVAILLVVIITILYKAHYHILEFLYYQSRILQKYKQAQALFHTFVTGVCLLVPPVTNYSH